MYRKSAALLLLVAALSAGPSDGDRESRSGLQQTAVQVLSQAVAANAKLLTTQFLRRIADPCQRDVDSAADSLLCAPVVVVPVACLQNPGPTPAGTAADGHGHRRPAVRIEGEIPISSTRYCDAGKRSHTPRPRATQEIAPRVAFPFPLTSVSASM